MPVERVPDFWDYLGQGFNKGLDQYRHDKELKQAEADKSASLMAELFNAGAVDSGTLQTAVNATGAKGVTVLPNKAERRKKVLETPGAIDQLTDEQKADLGFKTTTEKKVEGAQASAADVETLRNNALLKFANGEPVSDNEGMLTGLGTATDREMKKFSSLDPYLGQVGDRFVAGAMNQQGGRIPPGGAQAVADKAYADYIDNRAKSGLPAMTPEQLTYTKSFFDKSVQNALITQTKLDIDKIQADSTRANAQNNQAIQWFGKLNSAVDSLRRAQDNLLRASPALAAALADPKLAALPMIQGPLAQYQQYAQQIEALRAGQSALGNNVVPSNLADLLASADAATAPPGGAAGNAAAVATDPVTQGAQKILSGQATIQQLQAAVNAGQVTQQQANQIINKVAQLRAQQNNGQKGGKP
jgi:hypothetical protein